MIFADGIEPQSPFLRCWLWRISAPLYYFLPTGGSDLQCNVTIFRKEEWRWEGVGWFLRVSLVSLLQLSHPQGCNLIRGGFPNNSRQRWEVGRLPVRFSSSACSPFLRRSFTRIPLPQVFFTVAPVEVVLSRMGLGQFLPKMQNPIKRKY